jgi:large repetitive protein
VLFFIHNLRKIEKLPQDAETWQASFELPSDAGQTGSENLSFQYKGADSLDNINESILCCDSFQVCFS